LVQQAYFRNPWASPGMEGGSNVCNATKCILINTILIPTAAKQQYKNNFCLLSR